MSKFIKELLTLRRQATVGPMEYSLRPSDKPDEAPGSVISLASPGQAVAVAVAPRYAREQFENDAKFIVFAYETAAAVIDQVVADAGVKVLDARISHLAYAPEIAQAMLQRQQANAIIAARTRIVAGAVGMVEMALAELQKNGVVHLDEERKAQMVSNLLVVLCGERSTQPIVNAGTLY